VYGTLDHATTSEYYKLLHKLAHDIFVYQRLDVELIDDVTALSLIGEGKLELNNLVLLGQTYDHAVLKWLMEKQMTPGKIPISFHAVWLY
jgi:hypothetical protein